MGISKDYQELKKLGIDIFPGYYNFVHYYPDLRSLKIMNNSDLTPYLLNERRDISLYIHIPFCFTKCRFCFYSTRTNEAHNYVKDYIEKLIVEIEKVTSKLNTKKFKTIYIGGGTPSYLSETLIERLLKYLDKKFNFSTIDEITFEGEPVSIAKKYQTLIDLGVTRISFGIQSLDDNVLKYYRRYHNKETALKTIELLQKSSIKTFNVDFIYGLKGQSIEDVKNIVNYVYNSNIPSITFYQLWYASHTKKEFDWKNKLESIESISEMKNLIYGNLGDSYKVNNINWFVKEEKDKCKHYNYTWNNNPYIGFGLSAYSYVDGLCFKNPSGFKQYDKFVSDKDTLFHKSRIINNKENAMRTIILGLKTDKGINLTEIFKRYNAKIPAVVSFLDELTRLGYMKFVDNFYSFTLKGVFWGDSILNHLIKEPL